MRALVITEHGPPEVLRVQDRPDPEPGSGEVRVSVKAAGINFADLMARMGLYPEAPKPPSVVGYEFAGEVESLGDGVEDLAVGDRVIGGCRFGGYAELVCVGSDQLVPLPDDWSFEEGAALPVNYATAYAGLVRYGSLMEGERVLLHAAAGGVGIAATQVAQPGRGRGLRHRLRLEARGDPRLRRGPPDRLPLGGLRQGGAAHHRRRRSRSTS